MSKAGKVGTVVLFLFSIGVVIFALKLIGNIEESQNEIEKLTVSLKETTAELGKVREEKTTLEEKLVQEKELKENIQRELGQKIKELLRSVKTEKENKIAWKNKFEDIEKIKTKLENRCKEAQQTILNLQEMLKESPPDVKPQVVEVSPPKESSPAFISKKLPGKVLLIARPFLSLELDRGMIADLQPTLSVYRRGKLIKELAAKGIRYAALIARVSDEESLEGIRENDRMSLLLFPGVTEMFGSSPMEGEMLDVIRPGFLNIDLGREGLADVEPTLLIYRGGKLFRKIELKDMNHLTVMVETVEGTSLREIKRKDIVKISP